VCRSWIQFIDDSCLRPRHVGFAEYGIIRCGEMQMPLDELDCSILEELEDDARLAVQKLARKLGMKRTTVGYRLNKLISSGVLSFACIANAEILGYQIPLGVGIHVSPGKTDAVARRLAALPDVKVVNLVAGRYGIFAWALLKDRRDLTRFVSQDLGQIRDITAVETMLAFDWVRESWRYFRPQPEKPFEDVEYQPSDLDLAIIRSLQQDPRQTITDLARSSGCSKPVAKDRLESLMNSGVIRLVSIVDPAALGYEMEVMILIKSTPERAYAVADELSKQNIARHVSLTTGNWQVFVAAQFRDSTHMHEYLSETLAGAPGVTDFEVIQIMKTLKFSMSFVDII
jgi:DNA-binding Lrp family transcriptional regulator